MVLGGTGASDLLPYGRCIRTEKPSGRRGAMSTRVGTLRGSRAGRSIWPAAILASLVMLTIAVAAVSFGRVQSQQDPKTVISGVEETFDGGTAANTPSELNAQIGAGRPKTVAGGTLANTPTELSGGIRHKFVSDTPGTTTPTELSGGIIGDGLPAKFYDRHQRG
jgi:hypothetical protein